MQLVQFKDWQMIFPSNWVRIHNRKRNEACQEIEAIYDLDFDFKNMFGKAGQSIFFKQIAYDEDAQLLVCGAQSFPLAKSGKKYLLGDNKANVTTLAEFIDHVYDISGVIPQWQDKVWKNLEGLRAVITNSEHEKQVSSASAS